MEANARLSATAERALPLSPRVGGGGRPLGHHRCRLVRPVAVRLVQSCLMLRAQLPCALTKRRQTS